MAGSQVDAQEVDPASVIFCGASWVRARKSQDVGADRDLDLIRHLRRLICTTVV